MSPAFLLNTIIFTLQWNQKESLICVIEKTLALTFLKNHNTYDHFLIIK